MLTPEQAMAMIEHCSDLTDAAHPEIPDSDGSEEGGGGGSPPGGAASGGPAGGEATVEELAAGAEALAALQAARAECARERARADVAEAQLAKCRTRLVAEKAALKQAQ